MDVSTVYSATANSAPDAVRQDATRFFVYYSLIGGITNYLVLIKRSNGEPCL